ncbi:hypothetical protein IAQ61_011922 [Plenodomus lingam]|uniref:Expansin-like EG45 domain-containing protein n=1 Tax=Leptosphaeria maculans (strain JN3 / isolate v23.1.3 / race Av1-4-5-6-7-8) TaxID=985895 RepID=E5ABI6_LEPMJ|nr:hypothetical protein LEMA_P021570.1 [Plenodomus lingam JN3]KAH9860138.1 hypothetical protein IAQ61_011922 [Plenodomus lingam]CBY01027.1 hypothetical protein LEMA_P021570.1 [Plenodomus lingam JN3]
MKSYLFTLLPLAGVTVAKSVCPRKTLTSTDRHTVYRTVPTVSPVVDVATPSSVCSRRIVTTTTTEKVYITVDAPNPIATTPSVVTTPSAGVTGPEAINITTTSTIHITTTITRRPSALPPYSNSTRPATTLSSSSSSSTASSSSSSLTSSFLSSPTPSPPSLPTSSPTSSSTSDPTMSVSRLSGQATFYGGNVAGGMCSFTGYTIPSNLYGTALSDSNWAGANSCGSCVSVTGPRGNKITAMVVDQCPGCGPNHLDLFPDAFAKLDNPNRGVIPVSWEFVPCGITSPIILKNKEGTSRWWFSMQVMNSNVRVTKLEVSTDGGRTWRGTERKPYNFFEFQSGFGTDSVDIKITSVGGKVITVKDVSIAAQTTKSAGSNFSS